ncbi:MULTISPECIES: DUF3192 domain-containing protein [unclassified Idiomarina]|uniref:DUF3192 domain-containing protein n=1 Tax=unclassified Idiomarina TaxID=2614829 RepID=UPI000C8FB309|nr:MULTISPECIES: DUF3192 domain-containing protein [unclassified Idiomarina]MAD54308.1 hypothetical protein [Idiomarinaceae bacterium]NQZ03856.1 DUF3192 domain-containing protein [Idiomarina sp.]|tara:strand:- start:542 stop:919 length:378 start_codon:yes stop_codon:yes gene_type:complete
MEFRKLALMGLAGMMTLSLSGCIVVSEPSWDKDDPQYDQIHDERGNRQAIAKLNLNADFESVRNDLGTPDFSERWIEDNNEYQVLFYRTQRVHADGMTTKDECTPIVFKNGSLIGTGQMALDKVM